MQKNILNKSFDIIQPKRRSDLTKTPKKEISDMFHIRSKPIAYSKGDNGELPEMSEEYLNYHLSMQKRVINISDLTTNCSIAKRDIQKCSSDILISEFITNSK